MTELFDKEQPRWQRLAVGTWMLLLCNAIGTARGLNIVITGSSQGIGLDAARRLLSQGHHVIHACRNTERAEVAAREAGGGVPMVCDLSDFASIRTFAADEQHVLPSDIDVLCLNAGLAPSTRATRPKLTRDGLEECIGVNHLGHFLLANLLKDRLGRSSSLNGNGGGGGGGGGRLVITASSVHDPESPGGSVGGKGGATLGNLSGLGVRLHDSATSSRLAATMPDGVVEYDGRKVYNDSKLCNVLFLRGATARWDSLSVRAFNPGFIPSSGLFREPRKDNWLGATIFTWAMGLAGVAVPVSVGGQRLAYMATADDVQVPSGSYFCGPDATSRAVDRESGFGPGIVSKEASDDDLVEKLWDRSMSIVGLPVETI